jgi:hypothetical protein
LSSKLPNELNRANYYDSHNVWTSVMTIKVFVHEWAMADQHGEQVSNKPEMRRHFEIPSRKNGSRSLYTNLPFYAAGLY